MYNAFSNKLFPSTYKQYNYGLRSAHVDVPAEMQQSHQHRIERPIVKPGHSGRSSVVAFVQHVHAVTETEQVDAFAHLHCHVDGMDARIDVGWTLETFIS